MRFKSVCMTRLYVFVCACMQGIFVFAAVSLVIGMVGLHMLDIPKARAQCRAFAAQQVLAGTGGVSVPLTTPLTSNEDGHSDPAIPFDRPADESENETDA